MIHFLFATAVLFTPTCNGETYSPKDHNALADEIGKGDTTYTKLPTVQILTDGKNWNGKICVKQLGDERCFQWDFKAKKLNEIKGESA